MWQKKLLIARKLPDEFRIRLCREFPGVTAVLCDGNHDRIRAEIDDAEIVFGWINRDEFLLARRLELIHNNYVGVESMCFPELAASDVVLTNSRGVHSRPMAEHVLAMVLALYRNLPAMWESQRRAQWETVAREKFSTLNGKTVGLLGTGSIGDLTAKLCRGMDCHAIGYNIKGQTTAHIDRVYTGDALSHFLSESDIVVNTLPHTPATRGLIGPEEFAQMKRSSLFINVGRGATVDEPALISALETGAIAGAGLDVFAREPLPAESPLWRMTNVIICPHQCGDDPANLTRVFEVFLENLRRFRDGEPLLNVVDKLQGY